MLWGGLIPGQTLSVAYGDSSPEGRALGRTGRFRPHRSTAGKSLPLSCKLSALAKASPFRERWHGEAVTERVDSGRTLSVSLRSTASSPFCRLPATSSPGRGKSFEGRALGKEGKFRPHRSNGRKKPAVKLQTFCLCQSLSLSGEVARRSRDGEGRFRDEPSQSRCARQLFPFLSPAGDIFPRPGEVFPLRESPWQRG